MKILISNFKPIKFKVIMNKNMTSKTNTSSNSQPSIKYNQQMKDLVDKLKSESYITKNEVYNAMLRTDRGEYIDSYNAYKDW